MIDFNMTLLKIYIELRDHYKELSKVYHQSGDMKEWSQMMTKCKVMKKTALNIADDIFFELFGYRPDWR